VSFTILVLSVVRIYGNIFYWLFSLSLNFLMDGGFTSFHESGKVIRIDYWVFKLMFGRGENVLPSHIPEGGSFVRISNGNLL